MKRSLKLLIIALLFMVLVIPFTGCDKGTAQNPDKTAAPEKKVLVMGTNAEFPPFEFVDGNDIKGIDVDFAKAICEELGYELKIENLEFESLLNALNSKKVDFVAAGMTVTPEREEQANFTITYYKAKQVLIVKEDSSIASIEDLVGKKIGVQTGTTGQYIAEDEIEGAKDNNLITGYSAGSLAVTALVNGQIDAVIIDNLPAQEFVSRNEGLKIIDNLFEDEEYAMAFRKDDTELLEKFNEAMQKLIDSGKLQEIVDKYMLEK